MAQIGISISLPEPVRCVLRDSCAFGTTGAILILAYMDDFAILVDADSPGALLSMLQGAAEVLSSLAQDFGMAANLLPNKTEAIAVLRGRGLIAAQERLNFDAEKVGRLRLASGIDLRVVPTYKHLGVTTGARDHIGTEIAARVSAATAARHALGRVLLGERRLGFSTWLMIAKTCVLMAAGTWNDVPSASVRQLASAWSATLRRVVLQHRPPRPGEHLDTGAQIRTQCGEAPMVRQLSIARLRYFGRVVRGAPAFLRSLIQGKGGRAWRDWSPQTLTRCAMPSLLCLTSLARRAIRRRTGQRSLPRILKCGRRTSSAT